MIRKIFKGWNWRRALYVLLGVWLIVQGFADGQLIGVMLGGWPMAMALFDLGCAKGFCGPKACEKGHDGSHKT